MSDQLVTAMADLEEATVLKLVEQRLDTGTNPMPILTSCREGMVLVGKRFEAGEYWVSDLMMAGEIFKQVSILLSSRLKSETIGIRGKVVIGTVKGDIHDIGKDMVGLLLTCYGFTVIDLGVDVPPAEFVEQVSRLKPDIVGLSGVLTASFEVMRETVNLLRMRARQDGASFPIIIGGGMIDYHICHYVGADYWVADAMSGVHPCRKLMEGQALPKEE
jgi:methanogenic corrinoid protein MtbC1